MGVDWLDLKIHGWLLVVRRINPRHLTWLVYVAVSWRGLIHGQMLLAVVANQLTDLQYYCS